MNINNNHPIHDCPYLASKNKCVHKSPIKRISGRKRWCGYKCPKNCDMYCKWQERRNIDLIEESVILDPLEREIEVSGD